MTPELTRWLLAHPLTDPERETVDRYKTFTPQPDGAFLTTVLAIDR